MGGYIQLLRVLCNGVIATRPLYSISSILETDASEVLGRLAAGVAGLDMGGYMKGFSV